MFIPFNVKDECRIDLSMRIEKAFHENFASEIASFPQPITADFIYKMIEVPMEEGLGDYAFPCFQFSKFFKKSPNLIAETLAKNINMDKGNWIFEVKNLKAFLNFYIKPSTLAKDILPKLVNGEFFNVGKLNPKPEKVMIEFSQPNTHKEFHVGHIRNVALGDSLCRLFRYLGHSVIAANYIGDEGTHIAKCLWYFLKETPPIPKEHRGAWLGQIYSRAVQVLNQATDTEKKQFDNEISEILQAIEEREEPLYDLWLKTKQWSMDAFHEIYDWLDVKFDFIFFESEFSQESKKLVDEYLKRDIFIESEGAIGVDLDPYDLPFLMLRKSDGTSLYAAKDLVLALKKFKDYHITKSIYVVGSEQDLHFRQVFKTLELIGFLQAQNCYHLSYGLVQIT